MDYDNKDVQLDNVKRQVAVEFENLHLTDRAEAFNELSEWATHRRNARERVNERDGVPDRSENRPVLDEVEK